MGISDSFPGNKHSRSVKLAAHLSVAPWNRNNFGCGISCGAAGRIPYSDLPPVGPGSRHCMGGGGRLAADLELTRSPSAAQLLLLYLASWFPAAPSVLTSETMGRGLTTQSSTAPWRHNSTHSSPRHYMEVSGQFQAPAALLPG